MNFCPNTDQAIWLAAVLAIDHPNRCNLMVNLYKCGTGYSWGIKHRQFKLSEANIQEIEGRESETGEALELRRPQGVRMDGCVNNIHSNCWRVR